MSTTSRKSRKSAGIPFTRPTKTATPVEERSFVTLPVFRRAGDRMPAGMPNMPGLGPRSPRRVEAFIASGGRPNVALPKERAA